MADVENVEPAAPVPQPEAAVPAVGPANAELSFTFQSGPIGLALTYAPHTPQAGAETPTRAATDAPTGTEGDAVTQPLPSCVVASVASGGQAEAAGLQPGDRLARVGDVDVSTLPYDTVLATIRESTRPCVCVFVRPHRGGAGEVATAATPGMPAARVKALSTAAGRALTSLFSTGAQVVKALDRAIDNAIDNSTKQVAAAARASGGKVSHTLKHQIAKIAASSAGDRALRIGALQLDLTTVVPREALGELSANERAAFQNVYEWTSSTNAMKLHLHSANEINFKLAHDIAHGLQDARQHVEKYASDAAALDRALRTHVPAIRADVTRLSAQCQTLRETLTALEGRLTALSVAKADKTHDAWVAAQEKEIEGYAAGRQRALAAERARLQAHAAELARASAAAARAASAAAASANASTPIAASTTAPTVESAKLEAVAAAAELDDPTSAASSLTSLQTTLTTPLSAQMPPHVGAAAEDAHPSASSIPSPANTDASAPASVASSTAETPRGSRVKDIARLYEEKAAAPIGQTSPRTKRLSSSAATTSAAAASAHADAVAGSAATMADEAPAAASSTAAAAPPEASPPGPAAPVSEEVDAAATREPDVPAAAAGAAPEKAAPSGKKGKKGGKK